MAFSRTILLTSLLLTSTLASPLHKRDSDVVQGVLGTDTFWNDYDGGQDAYTQYDGDGSTKAGWPAHASWTSFNDMWTANLAAMQRSCNTLYNVPNMSDQEILDLKGAIRTVSQQTRVDHRFILAAVLQETKGCVRAKTTVSPDGTVRNPGVLQSFNGNSSCNEDGKVQTPCPQKTILGMIQDGVAGTSKDGHGFASDINDQASVDEIEFAQAYYRGARLYNSGAIDDSGDLGKGSATHCYATDIANRLTGWSNATKNCTLDDTQ